MTATGHFGMPGNGSRNRRIKSADPLATATAFYRLISRGAIKRRPISTGFVATLKDGTQITIRRRSSSDGTPAIDINVENPNDSYVRRQKIHFETGVNTMEIVTNTLPSPAVSILRSLKGEVLQSILTEHENLKWFSQGAVIVQTEQREVLFTLHEGGFRHSLVSDVSSLTIDSRVYNPARTGICNGTPFSVMPVSEPSVRHVINDTVRRILVQIDQSEYFPDSESPDALLHDLRAIAFVMDKGCLILEKGTFWTDSWQVFRQHGSEPRFHETKHFVIEEL